MSRTRSLTRPVPLGGTRFWPGSWWVENNNPPYNKIILGDHVNFSSAPIAATSAVRFDLEKTSNLTDLLSTKAARPYNPCSHTKITSSFLIPQQIDEKVYGVGTLYNWSVYLQRHSPNLPIYMVPPDTAYSNNLSTAISGVDWTSDVETLANLVKGLVNSKTLLAVSIKELPETIRMVCNPFGLLKSHWRKQVEKLSASQLAKKNANVWLEYQYGWNSTYIDFKNFAKSSSRYLSSLERYTQTALERYGKKSNTILQAPAPTISNSDWSTFKSYVTSNTGHSPGYVPFSRIVFSPGVLTTNVSCLATNALNASVSRLAKLSFAYGLNPNQLLESIWEALPYSFVVDWFVNMDLLWRQPRIQNALGALASASISNLGYSAKAQFPFYGEILIDDWSSYNWDPTYWSLRTGQSGNNVLRGSPGHVTRYERHVGLPDMSTSFWAYRGLRCSQGISGGSLILQRLLRS